MKKLSLLLDKKGLNLSSNEEDKKPQELMYSMLQGMVIGYANEQKGLTDEERRKYYKICDKFEEAIEADILELELEDDWVKFIKRCQSKGKFLPNKLLQRVENLIDGMKEE